MNSEYHISNLEISNYFNALRSLNNESEQNKFLDAFTYGQLASKGWLINSLKEFYTEPSDIYIFGGWIGILSNMFLQSNLPINQIYTIDRDPWCLNLIKIINNNFISKNKLNILIQDMTSFKYKLSPHPCVIINTVVEHLNQEQYTKWYQQIPYQSLVVIQGNNLYDLEDHVRCNKDLEEFMVKNYVKDPLFSGQLDFTKYTRYMAIWSKNELY